MFSSATAVLMNADLARGGVAEVDFRGRDGLAAERLLEEGDVGVLVGGDPLEEGLSWAPLRNVFFLLLAVASL